MKALLLILLFTSTLYSLNWANIKKDGDPNSPEARWGHAVTTVSLSDATYMYLWGGIAHSQYPSEFWRYNTKTTTWEKLPAIANGPKGRWAHTLITMVASTNDTKILMYGGASLSFVEVYNDLWEYDVKSHSWKSLSAGPTPRGAHAAAHAENGLSAMFVHGGFDGKESNSELWMYFHRNNSWLLKHDGKTRAPEARYGHCGISVDRERDFVVTFGSIKEGVANDMWLYQTHRNEWRELSPNSEDPNDPVKRDFPVCVIDNQLLYMFGGSLQEHIGYQFNDSWVYRSSTLEWLRRTPASNPLARGHAAGILFNNGLLMFGGFGGYDENNTYFNDLWFWDRPQNVEVIVE